MNTISAKLKQKLNLDNAKLEIGFFETARYPNGAYVAQVARYQEFGTIHIPPRPFFRRAIVSNTNKWINYYKNNMKISNNNAYALNYVGELARGDIINSIKTLNNPPNTKSTIRQKKSSKPLIDTGLLVRSVSYRVIND